MTSRRDTRTAWPARLVLISAALCAVVLALGGCSVSFGSGGTPNPRLDSAKEKQVVREGFGRFDLRTPPSRAEAGVPDGTSFSSYQRDRDDPFRIEVDLPGDRRLDAETDLVGFQGPLVIGGPSTEPPYNMNIQRHGLDPDEARDQLLAYAARFGLDLDSIRVWHAQITSGTVPPTDSRPDTGWLQTKIGYLSFAMQGRYNLLSNNCVVAFRLSWHADATPTPTPERPQPADHPAPDPPGSALPPAAPRSDEA